MNFIRKVKSIEGRLGGNIFSGNNILDDTFKLRGSNKNEIKISNNNRNDTRMR
jgi:hypothetical protein